MQFSLLVAHRHTLACASTSVMLHFWCRIHKYRKWVANIYV